MTPVYKFSTARSIVGPNTYYSSVLAGNSVFSPIPPSAYDLLETEILTGTQASVTFSSLNSTYGADYQHLQLRITGRTDRSGADSDPITIQFNGDTGANYARHALRGFSSTILPYAATSQASIFIGENAATSNSAANVFTSFVVDILDAFESSKYTTIRSMAGSLSAYQTIEIWSGLWMNTAALTSIQLDPLVGTNFVSGCRFSLYGLRSA